MAERPTSPVLRGLSAPTGTADEDDVRLTAAVDAALDALAGRDPEDAGAPPELVALLRARQRLREAEQAFREGLKEANR